MRTRATMILLAGSVAFAAGCGGSDKPGYCADRTTLENDVKGLVDATKSGGKSGLESQVTKIQSDATTLVSAAKDDFPTETSAITSSIDTFESAIQALPSDPSAAQIAAIAAGAASVVTSVKDFYDATKSECD